MNATVLRPGALPDPALVYDSVMKRTEYKKHPNNVSSVLWYWASIIIHGGFWRLQAIGHWEIYCADNRGRPVLDRLP